MSFLTIIVLALLIIAVVMMMRRSRDAASHAADGTARDPLAHDRDGLDGPLPGQSARTEAEVSDAARGHVGGDLKADEAARAARDSRDTGGTGTAALAGIATAGGAAAAAGATPARPAEPSPAAASSEERGERGGTGGESGDGGEGHAEGGITNPPVADGAGELAPHGRHEREPVTSDTHPAPSRTAAPESAADDGAGVSTNAPVADGDVPGSNAPAPDAPAPDTSGANAPDEAAGTASNPDADPAAEATNPPSAASAGEGEFRDRSNEARSNVVAGTASLAVGGATAAGDAARLPDGTAELENRHGEGSDRQRLDGGDTRAEVREMIKILNLREGDAGRLDLSKENFASLWRADAGTPDALVDRTAARLRHMLGHENR